MKKLQFLCLPTMRALNLPNLATELNAITSDTVCVSGHQMDMTDYEWEYLFVNDGSKDNTLEVLHNLRNECDRINIVNLSRNFGKRERHAGRDGLCIRRCRNHYGRRLATSRVCHTSDDILVGTRL